jgi:hypothetical protein
VRPRPSQTPRDRTPAGDPKIAARGTWVAVEPEKSRDHSTNRPRLTWAPPSERGDDGLRVKLPSAPAGCLVVQPEDESRVRWERCDGATRWKPLERRDVHHSFRECVRVARDRLRLGGGDQRGSDLGWCRSPLAATVGDAKPVRNQWSSAR